MTLYRKKPVVIVAHRIGDHGWPDEIWQGVNENKIILHLMTNGQTVVGFVEIATLEGVMRGEVGDWIIRGVKGEFYPCRDDIFRATYEEAVPDPLQMSAAELPKDAVNSGFGLVKIRKEGVVK